MKGGQWINLYWVTICLTAFVLYFEFVDGAAGAAAAPHSSSRCSPVLLLNCIGCRKNHPSNKCCASLRSIAMEKCFCSRLRSGLVDASTYVPIAKSCGIPIDITAQCKRQNFTPERWGLP
uniref:Bifunctional inhibitor/plant lipid transfer protein/seed storage helical domain-containing protein n=1 Tax=Picea sitchensis TaxID=3332 RepID=A9NTY2_PICSI|nr:unknown [Picea sitchensis]